MKHTLSEKSFSTLILALIALGGTHPHNLVWLQQPLRTHGLWHCQVEL